MRGISSSILGRSRRKPRLLGVKSSVVVVVVVVVMMMMMMIIIIMMMMMMMMMMITAMNKTMKFSYRLLIAI